MVRGPVLFLLCGLPFAGKSTLARAMADRFDLVHIEIDQVHVDRGIGLGDGRALRDDDWLAAFQRSFRRLDAELFAGRSVVWDATTYRRAQRDRVRRVAAKRGATTHVIYVATPESMARAWLERNRVVRTRWDIPDDDFTNVSRDFEPPAPDENSMRYTPTGALDQWLATAIAPLLNLSTMENLT